MQADNQPIEPLSINFHNENESEKNKNLKKPLSIFGVEFIYLALLGIFVAFLGWVVENAVKLIVNGAIDSRFHFLPFISPYGLIVFAFHIALNSADNLVIFGKRIFKTNSKKTKFLSNFITLFIIYFFVFFGELCVGNLWGEIFGVELWNYSALPLQVTQYAGLIPTLGYGTGAYLLFKFIYTPALKFVRRKIKFSTAKKIVVTLGSAIVLDTLFLIFQIIFLGNARLLWQIKF
ncbi:MAG: hypothetical protein IJW26_00175 [Clostridia bacterium]|nr:hypothetical protein [Clostridia bacterium]